MIAAVIGIVKLSLNFFENNSIKVIVIEKKITFTKVKDVNVIKIKLVDIKNAIEPSSVFENNFVTPYLIPTIEAKESDMLNIINEVIAIFSLNIIAIKEEDINIQDAPVKFLYSFFLVTNSNNFK